jgi:hypothetical protein
VSTLELIVLLMSVPRMPLKKIPRHVSLTLTYLQRSHGRSQRKNNSSVGPPGNYPGSRWFGSYCWGALKAPEPRMFGTLRRVRPLATLESTGHRMYQGLLTCKSAHMLESKVWRFDGSFRNRNEGLRAGQLSLSTSQERCC